MTCGLMTAPDRWLELPNARLPYWRIGSGPNLVFVHGWPLDARTWRHVVNDLSADFTCHLIDLPGAGRSEWSAATPSGVRGLTDVLVEAITAMELGGEGFGLIGHDSGGTFARMAAAEFGDRVFGLVLGNTEIPGHHPWRLGLLLGFMRRRLVQRLLPWLLNRRTVRWLMLRDTVSNTKLIESELTPLFIKPLVESRQALEGALSLVKAVSVKDFDAVAAAHPRIEAPVKFVWGADDPWFPLAKCRAMCATFGGPVELVAIAKGKLLVHEEHPKRFASEIRSHFATVHDRVRPKPETAVDSANTSAEPPNRAALDQHNHQYNP